MTKQIQITKGYTATIDDEDFDRVSRYKWHACIHSNTTYAESTRGGRTIRMHRLILNTPSGAHVDHIDHNGLNNTRSNLRLVTRSQNMQNARFKASSCGYIGVTIIAMIRVGGKKHSLGNFPTPEDAARAYDKAARELYGKAARTNFPDS